MRDLKIFSLSVISDDLPYVGRLGKVDTFMIVVLSVLSAFIGIVGFLSVMGMALILFYLKDKEETIFQEVITLS